MYQNSYALVIGQGSIGQRHARLLRESGAEVSVVSAAAPGAFRSLEQALSDQRYSYVVIANETAKHIETIRDLVSRGYKERLLVEKPLACDTSGVAEISHLVSSLARFGVAYNLRFNPAVVALKDALRNTSIVEARVHVGQYLPSWRPGTDYRKSSSGRLAAGGGALRDLSHEFDLILHLFGPWSELVAAGGNLGALEIETDEAWGILFRMKSGALITLTMNYYDRVPERFIAVTTKDGSSLRADLIDRRLSRNGDSWHYPADRDETYRVQHTAMLKSDAGSVCSFDEAVEVMKTIAAVETSAAKHQWIAA